MLGADPRIYQSLLERGAPLSPRTYPSASQVPGFSKFTSMDGLSPKGEWRVEDKGRRMRGSPEGDGGAQGPDHGD